MRLWEGKNLREMVLPHSLQTRAVSGEGSIKMSRGGIRQGVSQRMDSAGGVSEVLADLHQCAEGDEGGRPLEGEWVSSLHEVEEVTIQRSIELWEVQAAQGVEICWPAAAGG